jgi:hypothetical protein
VVFKRFEGEEIVAKTPDRTGIEGPAVWSVTSGFWAYTATTNLTQGQAVSIEVSPKAI